MDPKATIPMTPMITIIVPCEASAGWLVDGINLGE